MWLRIRLIALCCCLVAKLCPTLCNRMDGGPPGSSAPWDFPGKNTGVDCYFFSRGSSWPSDQPHISCIGRCIVYHWATREAPKASYNGFITVKFQRTEKKNDVLQKRVSCFKSTSRNSWIMKMSRNVWKRNVPRTISWK